MQNKQKILLLNPPGKKLYLRDYFCSKVSKADYINSPVDFVMLSGVLNTGDFEIQLLDAIVEKISAGDCLARIKKQNFDIIIALIGSVSLKEDEIFLKSLAKTASADIYLIGDALLSKGKDFLAQNKHIKGVITNFISKGIYYYLNKDYNKATDLIVREDKEIVKYPKSNLSEFNVNLPIHEQLIKRKYRLPFARHYPVATTLISYGCPFQCSFCVMNTFKYSERNTDNLIKEFDYLKSLGVKEIFFLDQTFGINKEKIIKILNLMIVRKYNFSWSCFGRVDLVDEEQLRLMKQAGCHTIMFGVESASEDILKKYKKGYTRDDIVKAFTAARKIGIKTLATFIIGLPEETKEMIEDTIRFSRKLNPDYVSFNFAVPRLGTELRDKMIKEDLVESDNVVMDQSGKTILAGTKTLSKKEMMKLKRKAICGFYFRPSYIAKRALGLRSLTELKSNFRGMIGIFRNN